MESVVTPKGYLFSTVEAGFRKSGRPDLALAVSETPAVVAAMFTQALFKAAPVLVGQEIVRNGGLVRAVLVNTGQANASTGEKGRQNCLRTLDLVSEKIGIKPTEILPASTGVIGNELKMDLWEKAVPGLVKGLGSKSVVDFAKAIMTTDRFHKIAYRSLSFDGWQVRLCGVAKGAGMICPNMATMISVLFCDAAVDPSEWKELVKRAVDASFNRVTVDGDTSTNDTVYALANGASGFKPEGSHLSELEKAVTDILSRLAYMLVQDGEGATKVMHIHVTGARSDEDAEKAARTIGNSQLVKTAMFGQDANWGRIIAALGRSGAQFKPEDVILRVCGVLLFKDQQPVRAAADGDDPKLTAGLKEQDIPIELQLGYGKGCYTLLASDLGLDYVKLNSDYRS